MALPPIILDTDKTTPIYELPLKIRQGDTGDELQVTLGKSFEKYTDLSKVDVELIATTPDQRLIKQAVTDKSGNTFKVSFPDEMYTNVGVFRNMYFKIGDDSTSDIKLVVLQGIGSIKEAGSYIDDFETLIEEAESYVLALKDFANTGNAKINSKVAELTGKMQSFVDKSKEDLDAAKKAWSTFQSSSQTAFKDVQDKRASDFNSQKAGFETDFNEQKTDFENRFKALLTTLQSDYDDFKALINKDVADFNTSLNSLDSQATDVKNKFDALKAQLDLAAQNISGVRTNLYTDTRDFDNPSLWNNWKLWHKTGDKFNGLTVMEKNTSWEGLSQTVKAKKGETYTFSVYARYKSGTGTSHIYFTPAGVDSTDIGVGTNVFLTDTWQRVSGTVTLNAGSTISAGIAKSDKNDNVLFIAGPKLEKGSLATDWCLNLAEIATDESVQTSIKNALGNYSTTAEVDSKISTGVGQAKTYAEQSIKKIIGAAPDTLDTIDELADAVTKNKDGVQAINDGITKKADKTELANYESKAEVISKTDYEAKKTAGTLENKFYIVTDDTEAS